MSVESGLTSLLFRLSGQKGAALKVDEDGIYMSTESRLHRTLWVRCGCNKGKKVGLDMDVPYHKRYDDCPKCGHAAFWYTQEGA